MAKHHKCRCFHTCALQSAIKPLISHHALWLMYERPTRFRFSIEMARELTLKDEQKSGSSSCDWQSKYRTWSGVNNYTEMDIIVGLQYINLSLQRWMRIWEFSGPQRCIKKKVIWSDESSLSIFLSGRVWSTQRDQCRPECLTPTVERSTQINTTSFWVITFTFITLYQRVRQFSSSPPWKTGGRCCGRMVFSRAQRLVDSILGDTEAVPIAWQLTQTPFWWFLLFN